MGDFWYLHFRDGKLGTHKDKTTCPRSPLVREHRNFNLGSLTVKPVLEPNALPLLVIPRHTDLYNCKSYVTKVARNSPRLPRLTQNKTQMLITSCKACVSLPLIQPLGNYRSLCPPSMGSRHTLLLLLCLVRWRDDFALARPLPRIRFFRLSCHLLLPCPQELTEMSPPQRGLPWSPLPK